MSCSIPKFAMTKGGTKSRSSGYKKPNSLFLDLGVGNLIGANRDCKAKLEIFVFIMLGKQATKTGYVSFGMFRFVVDSSPY